MRPGVQRLADKPRVWVQRAHKCRKPGRARGRETVYEIASVAQPVLLIDEHGVIARLAHLLDDIRHAICDPRHELWLFVRDGGA